MSTTTRTVNGVELPTPGTYGIDASHTHVGFTVRHMMFAKVRGQFKTWTATLAWDAANPAKSTVEVMSNEEFCAIQSL